MRSLLNKIRISQPPQVVEAASLYEYQSEVKWGSKQHEFETTLFVVFDGDTRHHFSSARIVVYYDKAECIKDPPRSLPCIRQLGSVTHNLRGQVHHAPTNDYTLPQLTVTFKVVPLYKKYLVDAFGLVLQSSDDKPRLRNRRNNSVHVLLESELSMTPDTVSLSVAFEHSRSLHTCRRELKYCLDHHLPLIHYGLVRIVRVVPKDITRPRTTTCRLPTELLIKIFEDVDSCEWQHDLLSFAQVCRRWSCSLRLLFTRLECPEWENHCRIPQSPCHSPDPYAFAKAFTKTPVLGLGIRRLVLDEHAGISCEEVWNFQRMQTCFPPALVAVLRATKDLRRLHISPVYSSRANTSFSALPELPDIHTLSITQSRCRYSPSSLQHWHYTLSTVQLARCMARWPTLTSLTVANLVPGSLGMRRFFLQPPACALTRLCIRDSCISDADLLYLTASSAKTLIEMTLVYLYAITPAGLHAFLDSISQQVTSLKINLWGWPPSSLNATEQPLDTLVDKMSHLEALGIGGKVASECMLRRRSEMFERSCSSGDAAVPVVRLSICRDYVPGLYGRTHDKEWPGWQMV